MRLQRILSGKYNGYVSYGQSQSSVKTRRDPRLTSVMSPRLCWFTLCYMWWGSTLHLVSTQTMESEFDLTKGIRNECGVVDRRSVHSMLECAAECSTLKSCYDFNFGFGQCELLSAAAACRADSPGWTHGHSLTGKWVIFKLGANLCPRNKPHHCW